MRSSVTTRTGRTMPKWSGLLAVCRGWLRSRLPVVRQIAGSRSESGFLQSWEPRPLWHFPPHVLQNSEFPCVFVPCEKSSKFLGRPFRAQKRPKNAVKRVSSPARKNTGSRNSQEPGTGKRTAALQENRGGTEKGESGVQG